MTRQSFSPKNKQFFKKDNKKGKDFRPVDKPMDYIEEIEEDEFGLPILMCGFLPLEKRHDRNPSQR